MPLPEAPPRGTLPFEPPPEFAPDMAEFWRLWREEKFWACHEALEAVWLQANEPRKRFLNCLIHGAAATFQHRRGNAVGAARQGCRALVKLEPYRPSYEKLDVSQFLEGLAREIAPSMEQLTLKQRASLKALETRLRAQYNQETRETGDEENRKTSQ